MNKALILKLSGGAVAIGGIITISVISTNKNGRMGDEEWGFYYRFLGYKYLSTKENGLYSLGNMEDVGFPLAKSTVEYEKFKEQKFEFYKYKCNSYDINNSSHENLKIICGEIGSEEAKKFYQIWQKNKPSNDDDIEDKKQEFRKCEWAKEEKNKCLEIFKHKSK